MVWGGWGVRSILGAGRGKGDKARMAGSWAVPWAAGGREVGKGRVEGLDEMCVCRLAVAHWAEGGGSRETGPACPGENADGPGKMGGTERRDPGEAGGSKGGEGQVCGKSNLFWMHHRTPRRGSTGCWPRGPAVRSQTWASAANEDRKLRVRSRPPRTACRGI